MLGFVLSLSRNPYLNDCLYKDCKNKHEHLDAYNVLNMHIKNPHSTILSQPLNDTLLLTIHVHILLNEHEQ